MKTFRLPAIQICKKPAVLLTNMKSGFHHEKGPLESAVGKRLLDGSRGKKPTPRMVNMIDTASRLSETRTKKPFSNIPRDFMSIDYIDMLVEGRCLPPVVACVTRCAGKTVVADNDMNCGDVKPGCGVAIDLIDGHIRMESIRSMLDRGVRLPDAADNVAVQLHFGLSWAERVRMHLRLCAHRRHVAFRGFDDETVDYAECACIFGEYVTAELSINENSPLHGLSTPFGPVSCALLADVLAMACEKGRMRKMLEDDDVGGAVEFISYYLSMAEEQSGIKISESNDPELSIARCLLAIEVIDNACNQSSREHKRIMSEKGKEIMDGTQSLLSIIKGHEL